MSLGDVRCRVKIIPGCQCADGGQRAAGEAQGEGAGGFGSGEGWRAAGRDSQHEVLLPAGLAAAHGDCGAFDILHLQRHVCVEFLCVGETRGSNEVEVRARGSRLTSLSGQHPPHPSTVPLSTGDPGIDGVESGPAKGLKFSQGGREVSAGWLLLMFLGFTAALQNVPGL